ncbi:putative RTA1 domain protein [Rhizodiscina lignyota]|uniref:RTA1 domain protein n=1 Tax=Rhizodiscina lignyota TaxID=1504668 RepID=A0A9P4M5D9_9PEZI|nr:putative RTA1 domain protein [Rhizodiscina lignyota]
MGTDYKTASWSEYRYYPNKGAAVLFIVLFALATGFHVYKMFRTRTWFFIAFVIGGCFEWIGYIGRVINSTQSPNWTLGPYIIQSLLLLLAPALFAASMYMMLGRIILLVDGDSHSIIKRRFLTKIFVSGDVTCFLLQGAGGGIQSTGKTNPSNVKLGEDVILGGLLVQVIVFALFIVTGIIFHLRLSKMPTAASQSMPWRSHMYVLYATNTLIMIRSVFRVIEYAMGNNGYLLRNEVFLYVFDAVLMLAVMLVYIWKYPSEIAELLHKKRRGGEEAGQVMMEDLGEPHRLETPRKER